MNSSNYGVNAWIQTHGSVGESDVDILDNAADNNDGAATTSTYMVNGNVTDEDLDHMAAENLIFMARDGQLSEIIAASEGNVLVSGDSGVIAYAESFDDDAQVVTEEVITDDWVEHQGADRVEIAAEQIAGNSSSQELLYMEQDEYTARRPHPCDFCSRRFRKKASLNAHMSAHKNDRPYLCKLCGARFSRRAELLNHFKTHPEAQDGIDPEVNEEVAAISKPKFEQPHKPMDDHYYEQDWIFFQNTVNTYCKQQSNTLGANIADTAAAVPTATRGRISRLKPKEETTPYVVYSDRSSLAGLEYTNTQELQAASSSTQTSQVEPLLEPIAQAPAQTSQARFPVLDEGKPFVCQQCGLAFAREKALLSHAKTHRVDSPFECNQCQEMFLDNSSLQEHQKTHQFEESNSEYDPASADDSVSESEADQLYGDFYCSKCGIGFHRQDLLRRHAKQHEKLIMAQANAQNTYNLTDNNYEYCKDAPHCCHTCGKAFPTALELLAHAEIHARNPSFKCVLCGTSFYEEQAIKRHLHTRHPNELRPNSCVLCGKECRDRKALIKHAWDHSREKCHSCSKCGKNFHNKARLKRHMASHRDKSVNCEVCNKEFPDGRSLSNHRHSHSTTSNGKLFPCHECGKTFGSRSSQQIHVRIHTGERPYGCRYCYKAFADGGTLRKHERIHTGEKPYACSVCPRAFNQRVVLREHVRSHHSGLDVTRGTYHCTVCTADLGSSNELIQHLIQHSDSNTAKQRQPIVGPRKYKRRRKLQPHEIAHLRADNKESDGDEYTSDIDICDLDNVGDFIDITQSSSKGANKNKRRKVNQSPKFIANGSSLAIKAESSAQPPSMMPSSRSSDLDRSWEQKLGQPNANHTSEDTYKSLFQIDTVVMVNDTAVPAAASNSIAPKTRRGTKLLANAAEAKSVKSSELSDTKVNGGSKKKMGKTLKPTPSNGPRMIHTGKSRVPPAPSANSASAKKTRTKTEISRTSRSTPGLLSNNRANVAPRTRTSTIVDDYEIISPATQPPNQISSSPLHIKQEQEPQRVQLMYDDTHLLIDSAQREKAYEKFNPSIVNDLEEILRSPLKSDRGSRLRFISESSTPQFLSEEEQHLIKIEPTSPDLREMVENQQRVTVSSTTSTPTSLSSPSSSARTTRHLRQPTANNKYQLDSRGTSSNSSRAQAKRSSGSRQSHASKHGTVTGLNTRTTSSSTTSVLNAKSNVAASSSVASSYLNYNEDNCNVNVPASSSTTDFFSISEVVSAADAADAAAKAAAAGRPERKTRSFECEMCSAIFYDRTQLLEHVHIHI